MAATIVQQNTASVNSGNLTLTLGSGTTTGNMLFLVVGSYQSATTPSGFARDLDCAFGSTPDWANGAIFRKATTAGQTSWAVTLPGGQGGIGWVAEVSGLTSSPLDQVAENAPTGGGVNSGTTGTTPTTTQGDEWALAAIVNASSRTVSGWTNSFTERADLGNAASSVKSNLGVATRDLTATGTYSTTATFSASAVHSGMIATYKLALPSGAAARFMPFFS